jgi:lysophospholipase L1-like esterase
MDSPSLHRRHTFAALLLLGAAAATPILIAPSGLGAGAAVDRCSIPHELASIGAPLSRTEARFRAGGPVTIVALGSSSTEGTGATRHELSYPSRLGALLQARFPDVPIRVINRGVGGETAPQMLARLDHDVLAEKPDLVIWQLGTNGVLRDFEPTEETAVVHQGIARIKAAGADVMLMDLQYAPAVLAHAGYRGMEHILAGIAHNEDVALFPRFSVMRHWAEDGRMAFPAMLASDRLHMNDASYECLARQVAHSIAAAVTSKG